MNDRLALEATNTDFDRRTGIVTVTARLTNVSDKPLQGPFTVRVVRIDSQLGIARVANADNGRGGEGAAWVYESGPAGDAGTELKPGQHSAPRSLVFALHDLRPYSWIDDKFGLMHLDTRILGRDVKQTAPANPRKPSAVSAAPANAASGATAQHSSPALAGSSANTQGGGPSLTVGALVQISIDKSQNHFDEVVASADPRDPSKLIACSMFDVFVPGADVQRTVAYTSFDAGATWSKAFVADLIGGDPTCDYGNDGAAYLAIISPDTIWKPDRGWTMSTYRSADGGHQWTLASRSGGGDRIFLGVDRAPDKYRGSLYATYQMRLRPLDKPFAEAPSTLVLKRSDDGGASWSMRTQRVVMDPQSANATPMRIATLSDGAVAVMWMQWLKGNKGQTADSSSAVEGGADSLRGSLSEGQFAPLNVLPGQRPGYDSAMWLSISADGAQSLNQASKIADVRLSNAPGSEDGVSGLAVDPGSSAFKDRLYATWADVSSGRVRIMVSYSADRGQTWSSPRAVDDTREWPGEVPGPDAIQPAIAVNNRGVVGVSWYDRRDNPDDIGYYVRFSASLDGGDTWLPSIRVSTEPSQFNKAEDWQVGAQIAQRAGHNDTFSVDVRSNRWLEGGHTAGLAADVNGVFHAVWIDNHSGFKQLYTAPIAASGEVIRNGSLELAALEDVTPQVEFKVDGISFDRARRIIHLQLTMKNTGTQPIRAPMKLRALAIDSQLGIAIAANADNGAAAQGAVWDLAPFVPDGVLRPGATSRALELVFRLSDVRSFDPQNNKYGLIHLDARMLAK